MNIISLRISAYEYVHHSTIVGERIGGRRKKQQGGRSGRRKKEGMGSEGREEKEKERVNEKGEREEVGRKG